MTFRSRPDKSPELGEGLALADETPMTLIPCRKKIKLLIVGVVDPKVVHYTDMGVPIPFLGSQLSKLWPPRLKMMKKVGPHIYTIKILKKGNVYVQH